MDPGSGSGMDKNPDPGSGMNIPDLIFENTRYQFVLKILKFFDGMRIRDLINPGSGNRDKHPGSATLGFRVTHFFKQ
jgi:hypothetical protein